MRGLRKEEEGDGWEGVCSCGGVRARWRSVGVNSSADLLVDGGLSEAKALGMRDDGEDEGGKRKR